eukprot:CAMPEP_0172596988 /NCGR_PEP_ID=MMETSP1068-20121228/16906_1 /TAXON_ID=35684 /ORGANISM="Pseudopedinella elastica, Strain CCMP716" /LENGTH=55 /DNA_ID=CAMNT_0013396275 /DNA_START=18 /DNA_END=183 /DNA_ORIENTATION=+
MGNFKGGCPSPQRLSTAAASHVGWGGGTLLELEAAGILTEQGAAGTEECGGGEIP